MSYLSSSYQSSSVFLQENCGKGKPGRKRQLPLFDEFVMVLVRLRLGLLKKQIADRCSLSPRLLYQRSSPRRLLYCTMYVFKEVLITWPSKELVKRHLLKFFFKYPRTRVIIDRTELKIEKPGAPSSQKVT